MQVVSARVAEGHAQAVITLSSEIVPIKGVRFLGRLPQDRTALGIAKHLQAIHMPPAQSGAQIIAQPQIGGFVMAVLGVEIVLGSLVFTGSLMAAGKLQEILPQRPFVYPGQIYVNFAVLGVAIGALASAFWAGRLRVQWDGERSIGRARRILTALVGGLLAGFGARVAAGCTSGLGLSGAATLSIAAFVFLGVFFIVGLLVSRWIKGV